MWDIWKKISTKILAAGLVAAAAMWTFSCDNAAAPENKTSKQLQEEQQKDLQKDLQKKSDANAVEAALKSLQLPQSVLNTESKITLPAMLGEVKVTWASSNKAVIEDNGAVHIPDGTGVTEVKLTATLTKGGVSKNKEFTVSVYQKNKTLTAKEVLEAVAAAALAPSIDEKIDKPQTVTLKQSITAAGKTIAVSYQSVTKYQKHVQLDKVNARCTVSRDIVDIPAELVATLSCDGKTKPLTVPVLIPRIRKFTYNYNEKEKKTVSFDGSVLEEMRIYEKQEDNYGSRYLYAADAEKGTLSVTMTEWYSKGKWNTKEDALEEQRKRVATQMGIVKKVLDDPSFENFKAFMGESESKRTPDETIAEIIEKYRTHFPGITETDPAKAMAQFKALMESEKRKGFKAAAQESIQSAKKKANLPENASLEDLEKAWLNFWQEFYEMIYFSKILYAYKLEPDRDTMWIQAQATYDEKKPWHKQYGRWEDSDHNDLSVYRNGRARLDANGSEYSGTFNADFTELTYTEYSNRNVTTKENGKWIFTLDKSKTPPELSAVNSVSKKKIILQFKGYDLLSNH